MDATGATRAGWISLREVFVKTVLAAAIISALCHYLFDMDAEETGMFALPLALISLVLGFVLKIVAIVALAVIVGAGTDGKGFASGDGAAISGGSGPAAVATAATSPATAAAGDEVADDAATAASDAEAKAQGPSSAAAPAAKFGETDADRALMRHIRESGVVRDARGWSQRQGTAAGPVGKLVDDLYAAGARNVLLDFGRRGGDRPVKVYIELPPTSPAGRAPIFQVHYAYRRDDKLEPSPQLVKDNGQRLLVIELKR